MMTVYQEQGYESRQHYLESCAEDYDLPLDTVVALANLLGENEDFDGLLTALETASDY